MTMFATIFKSILGGISASSSQKAAKKATKEEIAARGLEDRKTAGFAADNEYYYKQKDQQDKREGFKNYNQFSSLERFAPNYQEVAAPILPAKPLV